MIRLPSRLGIPLVIAITTVLVGTGLASAAIPDPTGTYRACYAKSGGTLRVIDYPREPCKFRDADPEAADAILGVPGHRPPPCLHATNTPRRTRELADVPCTG
jgi:hypothetical protein